MDAILDKDDYTLEDLMEEDELIQECKALNARLTSFLKQNETVEKLVCVNHCLTVGFLLTAFLKMVCLLPRVFALQYYQVNYLVEDPPAEADARRRFKYPFVACEIFCCEVEGIYNTLLESNDLMEKLFSILHQERPLNSMLAGYFARVMGSLLLRRCTEVMEYIEQHAELLAALVHHIDTTSIAEVLARLVGADDPRGYPKISTLQWLSGTDILGLLIDSLGPETPADGQANAAEVLAAVARSSGSPLTQSMASSDFMERLVDSALAPHNDGQAATHALNLCIALLEPLPTGEPSAGYPGGYPSMQNGITTEVHEKLREEAIRCMAAAANRLVALLDDDKSLLGELSTSYGMIRRTVGQLRLKAVDLIAALLRTAYPEAEASIMKTDAIQRSMQLFLQHPFHNALHSGVAALLTAFEPGTDDLKQYLLKEVHLVDWLVSAPEEIQHDTDNGEGDQKSSRRPLRAGYCGHLTQIANRLNQQSETSPLVKSYLADHEEWQAYIKNRLEPRNRVESVFAWQCGRPATQGQGLGMEAALFRGDMGFASLETTSFGQEMYERYNVYNDENDEDESPAVGSWMVDVPEGGETDLRKSVTPSLPFAAFNAGSAASNGSNDSDSDSDSDSDDDENGKGKASHGLGGPRRIPVFQKDEEEADDIEGMEDLQNDTVVVEDEEAARGLVELQGSLEELEIGGDNKDNDYNNNETPAGESIAEKKDKDVSHSPDS